MPKKLNISTLKTVEDLEKVDWKLYTDKTYKTWVRSIKYPVSEDDLNRVCDLSDKSTKLRLGWSSGDLYVKIGYIQLELFKA